ncbi:hypothetical protein HW555_012378 [Spodoptera exigua]|uniref:Peptidase A2 domain-containing protein n=1 Tax=Spodoptera exigua TaxID=7107 RepID=A0A835KZP2_SPOEX|nr:hypothetical protein HW555_012378 [Spodoptera exigua]
MNNLNEIISRQETIFNNLKQISINYKKDGPSRKTLEYLEERLSRLNTNWEKFVFNHQQLEKSGATDIQYFVDDVFNNTKKMYEDVLQDILKRKAELPSTTKNKTTFSFDDINFHIPPCETDKTNEKQQELLRQQYCNFRAFERTVEKINFDSSLEKWELEDSLNILKGKWELIEKTNWELDYISRDEDSTYKQKYDSVEKVYDNCRKKLQLHIWNNAHYEKTTPKIVIPDFHGNYHQWHTFKDLYLESKLDKVTYNEYINDLKEPREVPDLKEFTNFLENKFMALEALQGSTHQRSNLAKNQTSEKQHSNGLRGLLDQGSQVSLVTEHAAQRLRLPRRKVSAIVSGVGSLSDPHFNESGPIDLLLGAEIYSELILNGVIKRDNFPVAQQTRVGWILCGNVKTFNCFVILTDLENMTRFWETEEISDTTTPTNEDEHCENYYNSTTERLSDGTYVQTTKYATLRLAKTVKLLLNC